MKVFDGGRLEFLWDTFLVLLCDVQTDIGIDALSVNDAHYSGFYNEDEINFLVNISKRIIT